MPDQSNESLFLFGVLLTGAVAKFLFGAWTRKTRRRNMVKVGTVVELTCFPVKSCRGIPVEEGVCTKLGLKHGKAVDRHWMVTRSNGDFVSQRQLTRMALIETDLRGGNLVVSAPGMPDLTLPLCPITDRSNVIRCRVWDERLEGMDCGDDAAFWLSSFLKVQGLRLLFSAAGTARQDLTRTHKPWGNPSLPGDQAAFSDWSPYMVLSTQSLAWLNERLEKPVPMRRFRPNIVFSGTAPFDEDSWSEIQIGESATFRMLDPCTRCMLTTVDPDLGEKDPKSEPLETLKRTRCFPQYGKSPLFGVNAAVDVEGVVRVGDPVYVIRK